MIRIILLCLGIMGLLMLLSARIQSNTLWWKEQRKNNETDNSGQNYLIRKSRITGKIFDDELMRMRTDISLNKIQRNIENDLLKERVLPDANDNWSECKKCVVGAYKTADWSVYKKMPDIKGVCKSKCNIGEEKKPEEKKPEEKKPEEKKPEEKKPKEVVKAKKCWYQFYENGNCNNK